jgi:hypothetical protein
MKNSIFFLAPDQKYFGAGFGARYVPVQVPVHFKK